MFWIDWVIISIISFSAVISLIRGFVQETLSLLTWSTAFFVASYFHTYLAVYFTHFEDALVRNGIAIAILFLVTLIAGAIVNYIMTSFVDKTGLRSTDCILGIFFGLLRGVLMVAAMLFFLDTFTSASQSAGWKNSHIIPHFSYMISWFLDYLQSKSSFIPYLPSIDFPPGIKIMRI
ncbi:CvpA family protein [Candidatus Profftia tarda]|uniref:CvpA family protein n=1 Tax=Candidatus Profftia tarda TaxID=1177216 RepID=UPI001C1F60D3|nr:CvpA family protein [Candidatus Profftia tarda]